MSQTTGTPGWLAEELAYEDDLEEHGTIPELFETSAERHLDKEAQLYKGGVYDRTLTGVVPEAPPDEYRSLTYRQMRDIVRNLAAGFRDIGLERDDRVGILSNTRMEWGQADLGLLAAGCVVTTVYTDSSSRQVEYLLGDPGARGVVVENEDLLERVFEVEDELDLDFAVLIDEPDGAVEREDVYTLREVHDRGASAFDEETYRDWLDATDPEDLASLIYTSGTTGRPKGVRLTHWNFRSNVHAVRKRAGPREGAPDRPSITSETRTISFLPLAHVFERLSGHFLIFGTGGSVGYAESTDTVAEDIKRLQPQSGASVPRVYERIFKSMREEAAESGLKEKIFNWALGVAKQHQMADSPGPLLRAKHSLADRLVYSTIREELGGNVEMFVSGGGSLSTDLCRIFNGIGLTIVEGYGLTETAPVVSVNLPDDIRPGTVGVPLCNVDVAIDEAQGTDYEVTVRDGDSHVGELLVRGPNVTDGYWNRPGATDRAFTEEPFGEDSEVVLPSDPVAEDSGKWFRTGDLVEQTPDGSLVIHDRLKQLIVLDTGKNVAPQPIEDLFSTDERVEQIMVVGDDRKFIGALVVPNFESLAEWADRNDVDLPDSPDELVEDERVIEWIGESIEEANEELEKYETIKKFVLVPDEWTPENNLLTPSLKKRRRDILSSYDTEVRHIYEEE